MGEKNDQEINKSKDYKNNINKDEEGNETQKSIIEFNIDEQHNDDNHDVSMISNVSDIDSLDTHQFINKHINNKRINDHDEDDDDEYVSNDTSKIEQAVGLIEINHNNSNNIENKSKQSVEIKHNNSINVENKPKEIVGLNRINHDNSIKVK